MATERSEKKESAVKAFKRINFFRGFLTTEHDWNDAESYHIEKRKLHNRSAHAPGVCLGYAGDLRVQARSRGDLSFEVQPGYAIDGQGNDLVLWEPQIRAIVPEEYKLPTLLYVVIRFSEELTDFIAYKENLEYKGHRRVMESARIEITQTPPDIQQEVELARILLEKGAVRIRDARDPNDPRPNEIDLRYVPHAGIAGSFFDPATRMRITDALRQLRKSFLYMAREGKVVTAHDALAATLSASALHACEILDLRNIFDVMALIIEMQQECAIEIETSQPLLAQRKEFADFRKHIEILKGILGERRYTLDSMQNLTAYQQKTAEIVIAAFGGGAAPAEEPGPSPAVTAVSRKPTSVAGLPSFDDWEHIKVYSQEELPAEIAVGGVPWVLVDSINVMDKDSEEAHGLEIKEAKDSYRSRQKLKYPDGTIIEDVGRAHVGGYAVFNAKNLTPGKDLAVVRRIDYVYGDYELEYVVDGRSAGISDNKGTDRVYRWRNWPHVIAGEFITKPQVVIKQNALTAGRDINMFRYWFYQPK
ncbi:MAG TPA: hypothetical protein VH877_34020 [Polyangia bacterium]|jgi:hypothetical protein|nr:hypothetical protein [Polyangia bacterium]